MSTKFTRYRDMQGKLLAVQVAPAKPLLFGNVIRLNDKQYIVKMQAIINGHLNINLEEVKT